MAALTAAATTLTLSSLPRRLLISSTTTTNFPNRQLIRSIITSSSSKTTPQFNITFAPPTPKPKPESLSDQLDGQLLIPWIVRDENGNLTYQTTPPERFLKSLAHESTQKKKKKDNKVVRSNNSNVSINSRVANGSGNGGSKGSVEPKYSKAARRFYNERFGEPPQRLAKVLAAAGVASRRSSEELIFQGKVTVNGSVCNAPQTKVDPGQDIIYVNGNRLPKKLSQKVYIALNKPKGYICSAGEKETKSVMSLLDDFIKSWNKRYPGQPKPRLFTVGRLDVATTGLIILTNDGEFAHKLSHPSSNLSKEYIATISGAVNKKHLIALSEGTVVEGVHCTPDAVELLPQQPDISRPRLRVVVHEGRKHEVRELVKNAGLQIHSLKRVRIGGFRLPSDLGLGQYVELNSSSLRALSVKTGEK